MNAPAPAPTRSTAGQARARARGERRRHVRVAELEALGRPEDRRMRGRARRGARSARRDRQAARGRPPDGPRRPRRRSSRAVLDDAAACEAEPAPGRSRPRGGAHPTARPRAAPRSASRRPRGEGRRRAVLGDLAVGDRRARAGTTRSRRCRGSRTKAWCPATAPRARQQPGRCSRSRPRNGSSRSTSAGSGRRRPRAETYPLPLAAREQRARLAERRLRAIRQPPRHLVEVGVSAARPRARRATSSPARRPRLAARGRFHKYTEGSTHTVRRRRASSPTASSGAPSTRTSPSAGRCQPRSRPEQARLAGARGADDGDLLARGERERADLEDLVAGRHHPDPASWIATPGARVPPPPSAARGASTPPSSAAANGSIPSARAGGGASTPPPSAAGGASPVCSSGAPSGSTRRKVRLRCAGSCWTKQRELVSEHGQGQRPVDREHAVPGSRAVPAPARARRNRRAAMRRGRSRPAPRPPPPRARRQERRGRAARTHSPSRSRCSRTSAGSAPCVRMAPAPAAVEDRSVPARPAWLRMRRSRSATAGPAASRG